MTRIHSRGESCLEEHQTTVLLYSNCDPGAAPAFERATVERHSTCSGASTVCCGRKGVISNAGGASFENVIDQTVTLWNFTEYVRGAMPLSNRDKNFYQAMTTIVNRRKILATQPAAPAAALRK
ncbi:MAG: hypothetical protein WAN76_05945 [Candidatus Sulfotelmatobacter sp.]